MSTRIRETCSCGIAAEWREGHLHEIKPTWLPYSPGVAL